MNAAFFAAVFELIIPVIANTPGAAGTYWQTDLRVFNPASAAIIDVKATLLQGGRATTRSIRVSPGQSVAIDDVMRTLFERTGAGALELKSAGEFDAASRTFTTGSCGSYGQFVPAISPTAAIRRGLLLGLGDEVHFRTNVGFVNIGDAQAQIEAEIYSPAGAHVTTTSIAVGPWSTVQFPLQMHGGVVRFESDVPVVGYMSVVDNRSGDAVFIPASIDHGSPPIERVFDVVAEQFRFVVTPGGFESIRVRVGDRVRLRIRSKDVLHGFSMPGFIEHLNLIGGGQTIEQSFTVEEAGTFPFRCTIECGSGHHGMAGQMIVEP